MELTNIPIPVPHAHSTTKAHPRRECSTQAIVAHRYPSARALTKDEIIRLRRDIHQHPELSFQEVRTAKLVADTLAEIGYRRRADPGRPHRCGGADRDRQRHRSSAFVRDMDALPILEAVDHPYKSVNHGVMHACGHDAHTAMLLGRCAPAAPEFYHRA